MSNIVRFPLTPMLADADKQDVRCRAVLDDAIGQLIEEGMDYSPICRAIAAIHEEMFGADGVEEEAAE